MVHLFVIALSALPVMAESARLVMHSAICAWTWDAAAQKDIACQSA